MLNINMLDVESCERVLCFQGTLATLVQEAAIKPVLQHCKSRNYWCSRQDSCSRLLQWNVTIVQSVRMERLAVNWVLESGAAALFLMLCAVVTVNIAVLKVPTNTLPPITTIMSRETGAGESSNKQAGAELSLRLTDCLAPCLAPLCHVRRGLERER